MRFNTPFIITLITAFILFFSPLKAKIHYRFETPESTFYADSVMQTLTLDERIGQLFMVYAETTWDNANMNYFFRQWNEATPGGIILFKGGPQSVKSFIEKANSKANVPLLMSVDGEYGLSMRLDSFPSIPYNMVLGAVRDNELVVDAGSFVGKQCKDLGIHINFAPVLDLNSNPENPVINYRSFGEQPRDVVDKGYAYLYGLQRNGVLGVGKHFPGHGNTNVDSHSDLPVISGNYETLSKEELKPFKMLSNRGLKAMMVGHLSVPGLDASGDPATLSKTIVSDVLRDSLGFGGLIFTDGMNMGAITKGYRQPFVRALQAGNDVLLLPASYTEAFTEVKSAVQNAEIPEELINEKCRRILMAKYTLIEKADTAFSPKDQSIKVLNDKIYQQAVTLLKNEHFKVPFTDLTGKKVALVENNKASAVFNETVRFYQVADVYQVADLENDANLLNKLFKYDQVIFALHGNVTGFKSNYGISKNAINILGEVAEKVPTSVALMANPYALRAFPFAVYQNIESLVVGYSNEVESQSYCAQVLFGGASALGKLSVSVKPFAVAGDGLFSLKNRLGFADIHESGMNESLQDSIDVIVTQAIDEKAMPGCQVLVAKDGEIVFNKSYGFHTYDQQIPVKNTDLYDLASVTKIISTLPLIMRLDEEGDIYLNETLSSYFPRLKNTNKEDVVLRDILRHTSGLSPHIAFQFAFVDPRTVEKYGLINRRPSRVFRYRIDQSLYLNRYFKYYPSLFNKRESKYYPIKVANEMYASSAVLDSIWSRIDSSEVTPGNKYKYSDLGFYYLQEIVESRMHGNMDSLANQYYFKPLGMSYTTFNPLQKFKADEIVPTENDTYFRKQLLDGYVHDQGAAMMGGVAGHAGLFSNAGDLAKILQMYLNGGTYGDKQYLSWNTIHYYSTDTNGDGRRALGFDKPEMDTTKVGPTCHLASANSFGHSGFTGTYVWVDPDVNLIYIFLSNRIHPDVYNQKLIKENVRTRIQEQIYKSLF